MPLRVGVNRASTFEGFCDLHDAEFFRPVETQEWIPRKENAFLLSFRAVAYEAYHKAAAIKMNQEQKQWDRGKPFEVQAMLQQYLHVYGHGLGLGLRDSIAWKSAYDAAYKTNDYAAYRYAAIEFAPILPIVACGGLHVEFDFTGKPLQRLARRGAPFEHLTVNITASANRSLAVFGWIGAADGPSAQLTQSFLSLSDAQKSHALVRLAFESFENTYMRERWWNGLPADTRERAIKRIRSGLPSSERQQDCLVEDGVDLFAAAAQSTTGLVT